MMRVVGGVELGAHINNRRALHLVVTVGDGVAERVECGRRFARCRNHDSPDGGTCSRNCAIGVMTAHAESVHTGVVRSRRIPCELFVDILGGIAKVDFVVSHVVRLVNDDGAVYRVAFQVARSTMGILEGDAGHVVRPLGEFCDDGTDAIVVADQFRPMLRCVYVMATDAVTGSKVRRLAKMEVVAMGTVGCKRGHNFGRGICGCPSRGFVDMAINAYASGSRVWKWNRADAIVLGAPTMATLATGESIVMRRTKIIWNNWGV
jgi:hypothetical protein